MRVDTSPYNALFAAIEAHDLEAVKRALVAGIDVNEADPRFGIGCGQTPLIIAACSRSTTIVSALLAAGADVNARDNWNNTAILRACEGGDEEMVAILLSAGADPNVVNREGYTAYGRTLASNASILGLLRRNGATAQAPGARYDEGVADHPNLADPSYEPSDEELVGLSRRAFADVRRRHEEALARLRQQIRQARTDASNGGAPRKSAR